jgi:hypothetical protein
VTLCDEGWFGEGCGIPSDTSTSYWFDFDTATKVLPSNATADLSKGHADCCNWNVWNGATQVDTGISLAEYDSVICNASDERTYTGDAVGYYQPNYTVICLRTASGLYFKYMGQADCCGEITIDYACGG